MPTTHPLSSPISSVNMEETTGESSILPRMWRRVMSRAEQLSEPRRRSDLGDDYICVKFVLYRISGSFRRGRIRCPYVWGPRIPLDEQEFWFHFPSLNSENEEWNPNYYRSQCRDKIWSSLEFMGVPQAPGLEAISKLFDLIDHVVSAKLPIQVGIWHLNLLLFDELAEDNVRPLPAATSSIEGLERVRLDSLDFATRSLPCPICLEDFEEPGGGIDQLLPRLPCLHHFHLHCIIQWLEKNHLCPVCRYPMPTD